MKLVKNLHYRLDFPKAGFLNLAVLKFTDYGIYRQHIMSGMRIDGYFGTDGCGMGFCVRRL